MVIAGDAVVTSYFSKPLEVHFEVMEKFNDLPGTIVLGLGTTNRWQVGYFHAAFASELLTVWQTAFLQQTHELDVEISAVLEYFRLVTLDELQDTIWIEEEIFERNVFHKLFACRRFYARSLKWGIRHLCVEFHLYFITVVVNAARAGRGALKLLLCLLTIIPLDRLNE